MCLYLDQRGSTYYFRRVIPKELQSVIGKREFTFSLRTKDREKAKRLRTFHAMETDRKLDEARKSLEWSTCSVRAAESSASPSDGDADFITQLAQERLRREEAAREESFKRRAARESHRDELRLKLECPSAFLPQREAAMKDLLREQEERANAAEAKLAALLAQAAADPRRVTLSPAEPYLKTATLDGEILDGWKAERKPAQKTIDAHKAVVRWFHERVGAKPAASLTIEDFRTFKNKLVEEGQSTENIRTKLSRLQTLMQWAFDNGMVAENHAAKVKLKETKGKTKARLPFDLPALKAIFSSPVFSRGERPSVLRGEAAYWLPLLALYTGARLEELGQLRLIDVTEREYPDAQGQERSAWFIRVTSDEADDLKLKNANSERYIPVHPELERLGFIAHVKEAKHGNADRLFPQLKPDKYGRLTAKWGEHWSRYRREICGVTDRRMVFHSFRHTFKTYARLASIDDSVQRQLMGHSARDVADDYGEGWDHQLVEAMKTYAVPGLTGSLPDPADS
ncbi:DUF6538 domain-containing protein [Sphingomicrobium arenosum]|uniref:DUF6538 domain-containing protein n=1 Tax=Sphingomicrobium arenosum TaxID=2233861 RepID=UPI00224051BE|nr:DUF6538 domain-containing protein [Sphingomicrobium arenosum]